MKDLISKEHIATKFISLLKSSAYMQTVQAVLFTRKSQSHYKTGGINYEYV